MREIRSRMVCRSSALSFFCRDRFTRTITNRTKKQTRRKPSIDSSGPRPRPRNEVAGFYTQLRRERENTLVLHLNLRCKILPFPSVTCSDIASHFQYRTEFSEVRSGMGIPFLPNGEPEVKIPSARRVHYAQVSKPGLFSVPVHRTGVRRCLACRGLRRRAVSPSGSEL